MTAAAPGRMRSLLIGILLSSTSVLAQPGATAPAAPEPAPPSATEAAPAAPEPAPPSATEAAPALPSGPPGEPTRPRGNGLSLVVLDEVPAACRDLAALADSPSKNQALSARTSLASCLVEQRLKTITLCDCEQSVQDIDAASAQSVALLDEVTQVGDAATRILALRVKGDLYASFATRMLATVPAPVDASEAAARLRETRLALLVPHVTPWQQQARAAYQELDRLARANPALAKNRAVLAAVRASRTKLAQLAPVTSETATATR